MNVHIKVYGSQGGILLGSGTSATPVTVYGEWKIIVNLPQNRDYKGTLYVFNCLGTLQTYGDCLGRSVSGASPLVSGGNTPLGTYTGHLYRNSDYSVGSYGPYKVVAMYGESGQIVESGRWGIMIHGGTPNSNAANTWYPLNPTDECIRVSNDYQLTIQNTIESLINNHLHREMGKIIVTESNSI